MKITQLPLGARFTYQGKTYVKSGPMLATCEGTQKLIPKYAVLEPLDGIPAQAEAAPQGSLPREEVLKAFELFYGKCQPLVADDRRGEMEAARERFLQTIKRQKP
jgi:hypothetical protein